MRYLGIDFGEKRVGVAVSDPENTFAMPLSVLPNSARLAEEINKLCVEYDIEEIVMGESKDFSQKDNPIMAAARDFAGALERATSLPVRFHPEFMTSAEAEHIQGKTDMLDASAAALILKSYLDQRNNQ